MSRPVLTTAQPPKGPLNGIVVADLTRVLAGPYCTLLLHDLGAQIIKIEQPEIGDDTRQIGPFLNGQSGYFASVNRGKSSIALNLKDPGDKATFGKLLSGCDVLIENYRPGTMEKFGLGWDDLKEKHPLLIYAAVSGFGRTGPYSKKPAYDLIVQAMGGLMSLTGHEGEAPTRVGSSIGDLAAALFAAIGILSAVYDRTKTGKGQLVDVAMLDCQVALLENAIIRNEITGQPPKKIGSRHPSIAPFQAYQTTDGYIVIAAGNDHLFNNLCDALGRADIKSDPRFQTNQLRGDNVNDLQIVLEEILIKQPTAAWIDLLDSAGIPCGPINTVDKVIADPQVRARNMVVGGKALCGTDVELAGNPIKLSGHTDPTTRDAPRQLDADRDAILSWIDKLESSQ